MEQLKIDKFNLTIIRLTSILPDIEIKLADDLYKFDLLPVQFNKDTTRLAYHHLILDICNSVKKVDSVYKVVSYDSSITFMSEYVDIDSGQEFINTTLDRLAGLLPINLWRSPYHFKLLQRMLDTTGGERIELEYQLNKFTDTHKKTLYSFNKIQKFGKRYGLQFLTKNFFEKVENKQLIIG